MNAERALYAVLSLAFEDQLSWLRVTWNLADFIDQENDADILVKFACKSEDWAELVAHCITAKRPGFWPVAFRIIEVYSSSSKVQGALNEGAEHLGRTVWGAYSIHLENCRKEVGSILDDCNTPTAVKPWLERLESSLKTRARQILESEFEEEINGRVVMEESSSSDRLWAIETLYRLGKLDRLKNILGKEELLALIPRLQLGETEKKEMKQIIEEW